TRPDHGSPGHSRGPARIVTPAARPAISRAARRAANVAVISHAVAQPGRDSMDHQVKYLLDESEMPRQWYNVIADLPSPPPPPLHPGTGQPVGPDDLAPLFPMALIAQEVSPDRFIDIPEPVTDVYRLWRPTPLFRARR